MRLAAVSDASPGTPAAHRLSPPSLVANTDEQVLPEERGLERWQHLEILRSRLCPVITGLLQSRVPRGVSGWF
jgi:hypothetical protein